MALKQTIGELVYKITGNAKGFGLQIAKADAQVKGLGGSINKMSISSIAKLTGLGIAVGAVGGLLVKSAKKAAEFETRIGNIQTLIGDDAAGVDKLRSGILQLTRTIPKTADELGASAYNILSAGITDASEALSVLKSAGKLSVAGLGSSEDATNLLTTALNAFSISGKDADKVANQLFETVQAGKTTVGELSRAFGKAAGSAGSAGIELEDYLAATAALTTITGRTAEAQNSLAQVFNELTITGGKLDKGLQQNGSSLAELNKAINESEKAGTGFVGGLKKVQEEIGLTDTEFKNLFSSQEGGVSVYQLLTTAGDAYLKTLQKLTDEQIELNRAFETQAETTANQLILAQSQFNELLINLGTIILPQINRVLKTTIDLFFGARNATDEWINELDRISAQSSVVTTRLKQARDGTIELTEAQKDGAVKATELQQKIATLNRAEEALKDTLKGNLTNQIRNIGTLKDTGVELNFLTASEKDYENALKSVQEEQIKVGDELELYEKDLNLVLNATGKFADENKKSADTLGGVENALEKAERELENFQTSMLGIIDASKEASKVLREDFTSALAETSDGLAKIVIEAEGKIKSLKDSIRKEEDSERRNELQKELASQQEILKSREGFEERKAERLQAIRERLGAAGVSVDEIDGLLEVQSLEEVIAEERRLAALNEFELFEERQFAKLEKIADDIITRRELENELTVFLLDQDIIRGDSINKFADGAIKKYGEMAASLQKVISQQQRLNALRNGGKQFHDGGFVGADGGQVHAGEYVVPANMVSKMGGTISGLENTRRGGGNVTNNKSISPTVNIGGTMKEASVEEISNILGFELNKLI